MKIDDCFVDYSLAKLDSSIYKKVKDEDSHKRLLKDCKIKSSEYKWYEICNRIAIIVAANSIDFCRKYNIESLYPNILRHNLFADLYQLNFIFTTNNIYHIKENDEKLLKEIDKTTVPQNYVTSVFEIISKLYHQKDEAELYDPNSESYVFPFVSDSSLFDKHINLCYEDVINNGANVRFKNKMEIKPNILASINLIKFLYVKDNALIEFDYDKFKAQMRRIFYYLSIINDMIYSDYNMSHNIGLGILGINTLKSLLTSTKNENYLVDIIINDVFKYMLTEAEKAKRDIVYLRNSNVFWYESNDEILKVLGLHDEDPVDYSKYDKYDDIFVNKCTRIYTLPKNVDQLKCIISTDMYDNIGQIEFVADDNIKPNKEFDKSLLQEKINNDEDTYNEVFNMCINSKRPSIIKNLNEINNPTCGYGISIEQYTPYGKINISAKYDENKYMRQILINIIDSDNIEVFEYQSLLSSIASLISFILQISNESTNDVLSKIKSKLDINNNGAHQFDYNKFFEDDTVQICRSRSLVNMIINTLINLNNLFNKKELK